jgi:hypothetical protein
VTAQLRIYTINHGRMGDFVRAWREGIYPLRLRYGFRVAGAWIVEESNQFVWVLSYAGPESWEAREQAYHESPERQGLDPDPGRWVARAEAYFVEAVLPGAM